MSGGKKFDQEKPRMDLLSTKAMVELAKVMTFGAKKYDANNWRKGIAWSRVYGAVQRHLTSWNDGETHDPETKLNHLAHAMAGIMFLLEYSETHPQLDDRYQAYNPETEREAIKAAYQGLCGHAKVFKPADAKLPSRCLSCDKEAPFDTLVEESRIEYERNLNSRK